MMEFVKSEIIVDPDFIPSLKMDYVRYFSRALTFVQANYPEQLTKLANTHFHKMVPTTFIENYVWTICNVGNNNSTASEVFSRLQKEISYFLSPFASKSNSREEEIYDKFLPILGDSEKCRALCKTFYIITQGIRLFGWERYRNNFLSNPQKLQALPMIDEANSLSLGFNLGFKNYICNSGDFLQKMATCWNFESVEQMCNKIAQGVALQPRVIGLILWYAGYHFGTIIV